MRLDT